MAQLTIRQVQSSRFPLGYSVTLETKSGMFTAVRIIDGQRYLGYYTAKAPAITEQSTWYNDECIKRERAAAKADADMEAWLIEAETRGYEEPHLPHNPAKCRCGDCLTYLAGQ